MTYLPCQNFRIVRRKLDGTRIDNFLETVYESSVRDCECLSTRTSHINGNAPTFSTTNHMKLVYMWCHFLTRSRTHLAPDRRPTNRSVELRVHGCFHLCDCIEIFAADTMYCADPVCTTYPTFCGFFSVHVPTAYENLQFMIPHKLLRSKRKLLLDPFLIYVYLFFPIVNEHIIGQQTSNVRIWVPD